MRLVISRNLNLPTDYHAYLCSESHKLPIHILLQNVFANRIDIMQLSVAQITVSNRNQAWDRTNNQIKQTTLTIALFVIHKIAFLFFYFFCMNVRWQISCQNAVEQLVA